ncbi:TetR/AcrR family transcriptional regulator [Catenuloplanes atrovinosus]|uniref:AcrR family transcriptional regulator n=1 Tax=Catenuloplanes atrovinosus TaxID=137266 RepID=A0AAE3YLI2_9ACTN|nr:TetR/AcrR family transcriptional regulator [Catenuloplanes atrovinosus]MDR7276038.1 AcrR family transcriptional regulator [Catenuloplanes atrovinosus]
MARTVDPVAHSTRRDAFLDAAQRIIQTKGYEALSIQDVLDATGASKGAFYHYFGGKAALLDAIVARMVDQGAARFPPPGGSALHRLDAVFGGLADFKAGQKDLIVAMIRVWMSDENAVVREHFRRRAIAAITPVLAEIIRQGAAEGVFAVTDPDATAAVFAAMVLGANEATTALIGEHATYEQVIDRLGAFGTAFERVLGAAPGALRFDRRLDAVREWFDAIA